MKTSWKILGITEPDEVYGNAFGNTYLEGVFDQKIAAELYIEQNMADSEWDAYVSIKLVRVEETEEYTLPWKGSVHNDRV